MKMNRRDFLIHASTSSLALHMRAAAVGLPVSFLLNGTVQANTLPAKTLIIALSSQGESLNCNAPGTYADNASDIRNAFSHPNSSDSANITQTINGQVYSGADLQADNSVMINFGQQRIRSPRVYNALPQDCLDHMAFINCRSGVNAHPEYALVRRVMGALRNANGMGEDELPAAIAYEMSGPTYLNSLMPQPISLGGATIYYNNQPVNVYRPTTLEGLMNNNNNFVVDLPDFGKLYDSTMNHLHSTAHTLQAKAFMDQMAQTRSEARQLGDELGTLLTDINDDSINSQYIAACALAKLNISAVIAVQSQYSGDNHADQGLARETRETLNAINDLNTYWSLIKEHGVEDRCLLATWNIFGRTIGVNSRGGRDHYADHTTNFILGTGIQGGVYGDLINNTSRNRSTNKQVRSGDITLSNKTISADNALSSTAKTLMVAAGCPPERADIRIPTGEIITDLLA